MADGIPAWMGVESGGGYQQRAASNSPAGTNNDFNLFDEEQKRKHVDLSGVTVWNNQF